MRAWSNHKWTGTSPGTSVIWTWSNRTESGTRYMRAAVANVAYMHLPFADVTCSPAYFTHHGRPTLSFSCRCYCPRKLPTQNLQTRTVNCYRNVLSWVEAQKLPICRLLLADMQMNSYVNKNSSTTLGDFIAAVQ